MIEIVHSSQLHKLSSHAKSQRQDYNLSKSVSVRTHMVMQN